MVLNLAVVPPGLGIYAKRCPVTAVTAIVLSSLPGLNCYGITMLNFTDKNP